MPYIYTTTPWNYHIWGMSARFKRIAGSLVPNALRESLGIAHRVPTKPTNRLKTIVKPPTSRISVKAALCTRRKVPSKVASAPSKVASAPSKVASASTKPTKVLPNVPRKVKPTVGKSTCAQSEIYVLELQSGYVYVGKTSNVARRLKQHMDGLGARFTKRFKPTGRLLARIGTLHGVGDGPERDETLRQMYALGPERVRGWKFCGAKLSIANLREIEENIRELEDLCRKCGRRGHFALRCTNRTDRHGHPLRTNRWGKHA
jgi:hypothetical protein